MDINSINGSHNIGSAYSSNSNGLVAPSELFNNNKPKETYKEDNITLLGKKTSIKDVEQMAIGAFSAYKYSGTAVQAGTDIANAVKTGGAKEVFASLQNNTKLIGQSALNGMGIAAMIGGGVSLISNTASVFKGKQTTSAAVTNVVTDTITSSVSAVGGLVIGGGAALALSAFKVTGAPITVAAVIGGAIGATMASRFFETSHLKDSVRTHFS